jgi:hypothetical protein
MEAMARLQNMPALPTAPLPIGPAGDKSTLVSALGALANTYTIVKNYFDEVDDLYQRELIDREFYLSRHIHILEDAVSVLRKFAALVPPRM